MYSKENTLLPWLAPTRMHVVSRVKSTVSLIDMPLANSDSTKPLSPILIQSLTTMNSILDTPMIPSAKMPSVRKIPDLIPLNVGHILKRRKSETAQFIINSINGFQLNPKICTKPEDIHVSLCFNVPHEFGHLNYKPE